MTVVIFSVLCAQVYTGQEFYIWSWSSITTSGSGTDIWDVKFPICAIAYSIMEEPSVKKGIIAEVAKYLAWEVNIVIVGFSFFN